MLGILFARAVFAAPQVAGPSEPVDTTAVASLRFTEDVAGTVLIDGCAPVELERRDGERWVPAPVRVCDRSVAATEIDHEVTLSATAPGVGTWRAVVTWGRGCVAGRPLVLAACRTLDVARSEPFEVRAPVTP